MGGHTIEKQEDNEFTFIVSELDVYQVEAIGSFGSQQTNDQMSALM
jgi:hypothetical protein